MSGGATALAPTRTGQRKTRVCVDTDVLAGTWAFGRSRLESCLSAGRRYGVPSPSSSLDFDAVYVLLQLVSVLGIVRSYSR